MEPQTETPSTPLARIPRYFPRMHEDLERSGAAHAVIQRFSIPLLHTVVVINAGLAEQKNRS